MGPIAFKRHLSSFRILNPFNGFAEEEHRIEVRRDPLLGDTSVYNPYLRDKAKVFFGQNDPEVIGRLVEESAKNCIFCGENVTAKTARYPDGLVAGGRVSRGEAVLFANLFSVGACHPVIALSKAHFLPLSGFRPALLADGLSAARDFYRDVRVRERSLAYATVNMNYLLPAGASLVHPHLQMLATPVPYSYHARLLAATERHLREHGASCFDDLRDEERRAGERFIGRQGNWHWFAAFSPQGSNEIAGIHENTGDLGALSDEDLRDLGGGIASALAFLESLGHLSFNFTLFTAQDAEGFRSLIKIVTRQNLSANYRNDDYFLQKLLQSELIINLPEELAAAARRFFPAADRAGEGCS
jgi:galactose-1-phosphate uridylyltransferase